MLLFLPPRRLEKSPDCFSAAIPAAGVTALKLGVGRSKKEQSNLAKRVFLVSASRLWLLEATLRICRVGTFRLCFSSAPSLAHWKIKSRPKYSHTKIYYGKYIYNIYTVVYAS